MKTSWVCLGTVAIIATTAGSAAAQQIGASAYGAFGSTVLTAKDSFEAVTGSANHTGFGIGGTLSPLWRSLFVDVSFWQHKMDGERVFLDGDTIFQLGIPIEITLRPVDVIGGWKFQTDAVHPYVGGGVTFMSYRETSDFSTSADDVEEQKTGFVVLAGIDVPVARLVRVGGEVRYRSVTDVLGAGGVSQVFGDDELGGFAFAVRAAIGQ